MSTIFCGNEKYHILLSSIFSIRPDVNSFSISFCSNEQRLIKLQNRDGITKKATVTWTGCPITEQKCSVLGTISTHWSSIIDDQWVVLSNNEQWINRLILYFDQFLKTDTNYYNFTYYFTIILPLESAVSPLGGGGGRRSGDSPFLEQKQIFFSIFRFSYLKVYQDVLYQCCKN